VVIGWRAGAGEYQAALKIEVRPPQQLARRWSSGLSGGQVSYQALRDGGWYERSGALSRARVEGSGCVRAPGRAFADQPSP
jgi:hypothetical protein